MTHRLERLTEQLVAEGRAAVATPRSRTPFAFDETADEIINDLEHYPQAYVLACLSNRLGPAKKAWKVPYELLQRAGTLDVGALARRSSAEWRELAVNPTAIQRMPEKLADVLRLAVQRLESQYDGDASRIWADRPSSATVVRRFLEFYGAGPKIANMAANILVRQFRVPLRDYHYIDISVDRQTRRVMKRLGFVPADASDLMLTYAAREAHTEYPGIFDLPIWRIGANFCHESKPRCDQCPLASLCQYASAPSQAG